MRQLRYIVAIEEAGSFTRAARRCHVAQPALSQQVGKLERELGVKLFERNSRRVQVTAAGQCFIEAARECLAALDQAASDVKRAALPLRGRIRFGAIPGVACVNVSRLLGRFHQSHPDVTISMREDISEKLLGDVEEGLVDLAIIATAPDAALDRVRARDIGTEMLKALVPDGHPIPLAEAVMLADLASHTFAAFVGCPNVKRQVDEAFSRAGLSRRIAFEFDSTAELSEIVAQGIAYTLLPASMAEQIAAAPGSGCRVLSLTDQALRRSLKLIWAKEDTGFDHGARLFLPFVEGELQDVRDEEKPAVDGWERDRELMVADRILARSAAA